MIEINDLYDYGYFIYQNNDYFKFSIDSILLAEFIKIKDNMKILDMCTGNAPIPMILTAKNNNLNITAVELQSDIYDLARKSIEINKLDNIKLVNCDIKDFNNAEKYDSVICNPPYFKVNEQSQLSANPIKRIARHEIKINLKEIIECAYNHLNDKGTFYLVHRSERLVEVINLLENKHLGIRRMAFINTNNDRKCDFFLLEAGKNKKSDPKIEVINVNNIKTYKNIFEEVSE